ncbi:hypothetical protein CLAFUW4_14503 [Fulvia fulva]|uniref:Uncharacterized protein n=1 Tax=Passalora fulva TaxID=5499 RepID=A0A9Q8PM48_PASFU|nr:uncharacterized protein CLAFUR5_14334 [Fulvia fulva]UJO25056.1 hypothetical protein CLAFUR5_14334 [Fulvia fulva]WPV22508.1 hypothetical protein CLAFUW4_14503 [Fulvia fulva]
MANSLFSPHGKAGPIRSTAPLLIGLGIGGGFLYWLRFQGTHKGDVTKKVPPKASGPMGGSV